MTPERWEHIKAVFQSALERQPAERAVFLASACAGDASLKQEVEHLLRSHEQAGSFIESPALDLLKGAREGAAPRTESVAPAPAAPGPLPSKHGPSSVPIFSEGETVAGRYRIVRFVAEGGMGEVFEAEDLALHERVALKTIRPEIAADARAVERFKREIHVARKVTHPNVCRIFEFGTHRSPQPEGPGPAGAEVIFLTMELLSGETLSERIARSGRLAAPEALPIVTQIAAGLEAAHTAGVIHRDFKSANVMLVSAPGSRGGTRAVITDFGLARGVAPEASVASISDTGVVVGTPHYMAPEQVQGRPLTPAADLYALGIVMYEMVTGARPFDGGSAITVAVRRLTEPPETPRRYVPDLDPVWESVILRCLERDPAARFGGAVQVAEALSARAARPADLVASGATASVMVPSRTEVPRPRRPSLPVFAVSGALVAVVTGYGLWHARKSAPAAATGAVTQAPARPVAARRCVAVLGFKNVSGRADVAWLSTAISEILTTDLGAGGKVRAISGQEVARVKRDLGLAEGETLARDVALRLRQNLQADLIVLGSYTLPEAGLLRIDLRLQDASTGELVTSGSATGSVGGLLDLVSRAGRPLRENLGLGGISPTQALELEASLPSKPESARTYAEGLAKLRVSDALAAREALEKAVAAEPNHPLPHAALAAAWAALGYEGKAREEAKTAASLSGRLPPEQKLWIEAQLREMSKEWGKAVESYRSLFDSAPDNLEYGLRLAEAQTSAGRAKEALVTVGSLRRLPPPLSEDPRIDLAEARAFQEMNDYRQQKVLAARAATKAAARGANLLVAYSRLLEATALGALGDTEHAMAAIEEARKLYESGGDRAGVARALNQLAIVVHNRGDLDGAKRLYERSLAIHREIGDSKGTALALHNIGLVLYDQGKLSEAQKRYDQTLSIFHQIGARSEAAAVLNDLAAKLQLAGDLGGAQKRYEEALAVFGELGEKRGLAVTLTNLAEVLFTKGDLKQAQDMHDESLAIDRETGDKSGAAYDLYRLGEVFAARGDLRVARDRHDEALAIQKQLGEKIAGAQTRLGVAGVALAQGQAAECEALAREAEELLRAEGAADPQALAQMLLAEALLAQGKAAEARKASDEAEKVSAKTGDRHVRLAVATAAARIRAASGKSEDVAAALKALEAASAEALRAGFLRDHYEARLAQSEIELDSGRSAAGRTRLQTLAAEARAKGFGLIARRAEKALGLPGSASVAGQGFSSR